MCAPKQLKACASRNARPTKYEIGSTLADTGVQYGWAVERHLKDGDSVLFNRRPSLHKLVPRQIISLQADKPVIGTVQTTMCGIRKVTLRDTFLDWNQVQNILLRMGKSNRVLDDGMLIENGELVFGTVEKKIIGASQGGLVRGNAPALHWAAPVCPALRGEDDLTDKLGDIKASSERVIASVPCRDLRAQRQCWYPQALQQVGVNSEGTAVKSRREFISSIRAQAHSAQARSFQNLAGELDKNLGDYLHHIQVEIRSVTALQQLGSGEEYVANLAADQEALEELEVQLVLLTDDFQHNSATFVNVQRQLEAVMASIQQVNNSIDEDETTSA
ncbi:DNA-directed RNA polymerase subunit [Mycena kentingensis (nom. inval.)]|nr:DNA-directed RNA polymerase subunit [Mycena kentingensis (nom. inval.)]